MGWFLFFLGILLGVAGSKLYDLKVDRGVSLKWWHYLFMVILFIWTAYGSIFAYTSFQEGSTRAGWFFILIHWGLAVLGSFLVIGIERRRSGKALGKVGTRAAQA